MAYSSQLIFAATLAQFNTAMGTTLPSVGATVQQAPIQASGIITFGNFTFTATTAIGTSLTAISSLTGLFVGLQVTAANFTPGFLTIASVGAVNTATLGGGAATSAATETITAMPVLGQIDFFYDGANFLKFFGGNPAPVAQNHFTGVGVNQMSPHLIAFLTSTFAATLGAPVPPNLAVPPPFVP